MSFLRAIRSQPLPAANSLARAPRGLVVAAIGASNLNGFEDTGFGDDTTVVPFPDDFGLYLNGTTPETAWPELTDPHGPVVGFVQALLAAGYSAAGLTWVQRSVAGSALADWYSTEDMGGDLIATCTTLGVVPNLIIGIIPSADTGTANAAAQIERKIRLGLDPMLSAWTGPAGPPGVILSGPNQESDTGYAVGLAAAQRYAAQLTGRNAYVSMAGLTRQPDDSTHLSRAGQLAFGARLWAPVVRDRVLTLEAA